jgi:hypothetical protein
MRSVGSHVYGTGLGGPDCGPDRLPHIVRQPSQPGEGGRGREGQVTWAARSNFHKRVASDGAAGTCTHWHDIYAALAEASTEETQNTYSPLSRDLPTSEFEFGEKDQCFAALALLLRTPWVCNGHWINRKAAVGHDKKQPSKVTPQIRSNKARATASLQCQAQEHPEL